VLSPIELARVLEGIHAVLRPGGLFVSQLLNYHRILAAKPDVINVREADGSRFTRRYEYGASCIRFTITREDMSGRVPPETVSVQLYPLTAAELDAALHAAGFTVIERYGGIAMKPFDAATSADLVLLARRR
jgi:spermidine synthase